MIDRGLVYIYKSKFGAVTQLSEVVLEAIYIL
jgi:hypothetical protein